MSVDESCYCGTRDFTLKNQTPTSANKWTNNQTDAYTVSGKNIPDIFDCNLKNDNPILIILALIFTTQLAIK